MADRRMFAKSVVESARFLKMPVSSQNLYFHLALNADDDGVVEAYSIINLVKAHEDDLRVLVSKGFVIVLNEDLVTYITDWREQNKIRADRKKDSIYANLLLKLNPEIALLEKKTRSDVNRKSGPSMDRKWTAQCSIGKDSVGKDSIVECSVITKDTHTITHKLDQEYLTDVEYESLINQYSKTIVDNVIRRIVSKPYHGCLNKTTISQWCDEQAKSECVITDDQQKSGYAEQLLKLANERVGETYDE